MGDEAETIFEQVWSEPFVRCGHSRPPFSIQKLPIVERYRPDYLTPTAYVEVQGTGRDQVLKMKLEKYTVLRNWDLLLPVVVFVWDTHKKRWCSVPLATVTSLIDNGAAGVGYFPEKKAYFGVPVAALPPDGWQKAPLA